LYQKADDFELFSHPALLPMLDLMASIATHRFEFFTSRLAL
jgi:hypothetical protein